MKSGQSVETTDAKDLKTYDWPPAIDLCSEPAVLPRGMSPSRHVITNIENGQSSGRSG